MPRLIVKFQAAGMDGIVANLIDRELFFETI
jgi:hypothetical protein